MAYKIGFCPQCDEQIIVQDTKGQWNGFTPLHRQADLVFEDNTRVRTLICANCLKNPNFEKLVSEILAPDSQACGDVVKDKIRAKGEVRGIIALKGVTAWQQNP